VTSRHTVLAQSAEGQNCLSVQVLNKKEKSMTSNLVVVVVGVGDQGPEPRLRFALQPLGFLYTLFSRSSHFRRQMSPRPTRRDRSKQREVEL
jgi:hypothetical protein